MKKTKSKERFKPKVEHETEEELKTVQGYELGIDQAGRGPVMGPMVYGAAWWKISDRTAIQKHFKFADSKKVSEQKREEQYEGIKEDPRIHHHFIPIMPENISDEMLAYNVKSLNVISKERAMALVDHALSLQFNLTRVYVDTVGDTAKYENELESRFAGKGIKFVVSSKADDIFPVVSAASICAKVNRDSILREWKFKEWHMTSEGEPNRTFSYKFGCGYPGDSDTRKWLINHQNKVFGFPSIVRFSWKTVHDVMSGTPMGNTRWPDVEEKKRRERQLRNKSGYWNKESKQLKIVPEEKKEEMKERRCLMSQRARLTSCFDLTQKKS